MQIQLELILHKFKGHTGRYNYKVTIQNKSLRSKSKNGTFLKRLTLKMHGYLKKNKKGTHQVHGKTKIISVDSDTPQSALDS